MTGVGLRIEREREVLATLLLRGDAYKELPKGFSVDWFETHDYRMVYHVIESQYIKLFKPVNFMDIEKRFPELKPLIIDITLGSNPLDKKLKGCAKALKNPNAFKNTIETQECKGNNVSSRSDKHEKFQFELFNGMDIFNMKIPEQRFLVKNLISECSVNFLNGEAGCGKSLSVMNLAISIAIGAKNWLGYEVTKQGKVLFLNNELAFSDFARRLKIMSQYLPVQGDISNLIVPKGVPALNECWDTLNETCERERPCLIVIDCAYFLHDKDENDSTAMKELMRQILVLRDRYNLAVLLVHHTKKGAKNERMHNDQMRGSNIFSGIADTVLQMRLSSMDNNKRIIKPTKFRHVSEENRKCRLLSLNPESLWFKDEGETDEGEHIARPEPTAKDKIDFREILEPQKEYRRKELLALCQPFGYSIRTIERLRDEAIKKGVLQGSNYGCVSLRHFDTPLQKDVDV